MINQQFRTRVSQHRTVTRLVLQGVESTLTTRFHGPRPPAPPHAPILVDLVVVLVVLLAFAAWLTLHVVLAVGLGRRTRPLLGWTALVVVPVAPWLGMRAGLRTRSIAWVVAGCVYLTALLAALR